MSPRSPRRLHGPSFVLVAISLSTLAGCELLVADQGTSSSSAAGGTQGSGGSVGVIGVIGAGGVTGTGGMPADSGTADTGSMTGAGGGSVAGAGGADGTGGAPADAGAPDTGSPTGTGGAPLDAGTPDGSGGQITQPSPPASGPLAYTAGFVVHVRPSAGTVTVDAAAPPPPGADAFATATAAPPGTFTLTGSAPGTDGQCPAGYTTSSVCFDVQLAQGLPRSLSNVFAQVVAITDPATGLPSVNAGALDYDPSEHGLAPTLGLWKYTAAASTTPGVLGSGADDSGVRTWIYASPHHGDVDLLVRVVASLGYSRYVFDYASQPFVDACAVGVDLGQTASAAIPLPFPFALYGVTASTVVASVRGTLTMGPVAPTTTAGNVALPSTLLPWSSVFAFRDDLVYGGAGSALCAATLGAAPDRSFVVTWRGLDFAPGADAGAHLTFSAVLAEGSNDVQVLYGQMVGPTPRAHGASAVVGVQDESCTAAAGAFDEADFTTGESFSFNPYP